jgi:tetratricopeptide (TPR) repeat protein
MKGLGDMALYRSNHDDARRRYEQALPLYRRAGYTLGEANCIVRFGDIAMDRSEHDEARRWYDEASPLYRRLGDLLGAANCVQRFGNIALELSDYEAAQGSYARAMPLFRQVGDVRGEANCLQGLGDVAWASREPSSAREHYAAALTLYERIREPWYSGHAHRRLARVAAGPVERQRHADEARACWTSIGQSNLVVELDDEFPAPTRSAQSPCVEPYSESGTLVV